MAETLTGWTQEEAYGYPVSQVLQLLYNGNVQHPVDPVRQVLETGSRIEMDENIYLYTKDSKQIPVENTVAPIHSTDGTITGAVIVFQDYTDKKKKNEMVQFLSYHDQLTGIYNRRYFEEKFEEFEKEQYMPVSMIMADINGLKLANDAFGHELGDQLLILSANMIAKYCRQEDIFSRVGGDEFIILMPNTDETQAHQIVQRIREEIRDKMVGELEVSISFGWDTKNQSGKPLRDIYKRAEDFMYQHKLNESPAMREKTIHRIIESLFTQIPYEREHSSHVGAYCEIMGHALHLSEMQVNDMRMAGNLHDIGKIAIDYGVLNHAGPLSETDWIETKRHAELGYRILEEVNDLVPVAEIVLAHHENWDGTGYPKGLSGNQIPLQSRIIRIADSYDAMICDRVYRKSIGSQAAKAELQKNAGVMFDPEMVLLFIRNIIP
jgi:diguanylate cyclase (GGDEF)-like protein/PAS domain S-box-containing protein